MMASDRNRFKSLHIDHEKEIRESKLQEVEFERAFPQVCSEIGKSIAVYNSLLDRIESKVKNLSPFDYQVDPVDFDSNPNGVLGNLHEINAQLEIQNRKLNCILNHLDKLI